jgi:superfamily II DNA or RNA helicase
VSNDLWKPGLLTVATYQALHTAFAGEEEEETGEEAPNGRALEEAALAAQVPLPAPADRDVVRVLRNAAIRAVVVDEAHHLRNEWWKGLTAVLDALDEPTVVALTATPPYDVHPLEWERYAQDAVDSS